MCDLGCGGLELGSPWRAEGRGEQRREWWSGGLVIACAAVLGMISFEYCTGSGHHESLRAGSVLILAWVRWLVDDLNPSFNNSLKHGGIKSPNHQVSLTKLNIHVKNFRSYAKI